jgi:hypothetical protein
MWIAGTGMVLALILVAVSPLGLVAVGLTCALFLAIFLALISLLGLVIMCNPVGWRQRLN